MKLIKRLINNFITWIKSLFLTKEQKQFAKKALDARTIHKHNKKIQRSYFQRLPRRTGFKKTPSIAHEEQKLFFKNFDRLNPREPKPKKPVTQELRDLRELRQAKRSFFIELISARGKEIQAPFIKAARKKKAAKKSTNKTLQIA